MKVSVISPVYQAERIVAELVTQLENTLVSLNCAYEIILVDDRSPDSSWEAIENQCKLNKNVKGIRLARNFGQHYAITAGLTEANGTHIVVIDCDLQDDPKYIPEMLNLSQQGADIVLTRKDQRVHNKTKNFLAFFYFKISSLISYQPKDSFHVGAFSLISKKVRDSFLMYSDVHRHYLTILRSLGFTTSYLQIRHRERFEGITSYTLPKLIRHALDGVISQSMTLLYVSIYIGFLFFIGSLSGIGYYLYSYFTQNVAPGYTSTIILLLLSTGLILTSMGILGIYISKIFEQVRLRPLYIIDKKLNFESEISNEK